MKLRNRPFDLLLLSMLLFPPKTLAQVASIDNFTNSVEALPSKDQSVANTAVDRVAMISSRNGGLCAGSLIDRDLVLTAWHCVQYVRRYNLTFRGLTTKFVGVVVAEDKRHDLAVLKLDHEPGLPPLPLAPEQKPLRSGARVITVGHPLGVPYTASSGQAIEPGEQFFLFNAKINQGSSGGPILNLEGQLIGVVIILNQLFGERELGDAVAIKPIRDVVSKAKPREPVSWRAAKGTGVFDLGYGSDRLLGKISGARSDSLSYAIGWDYYDRWRVVFRHQTLKPERVWGIETGPVLKAVWGEPALLFGRNFYFSESDDIVASKVGIGFEVFFLDVTVFHVMHEGVGYTAYTIGF